jgi:DNA primase
LAFVAHIPDEILDQINAANDILDVVSSYLGPMKRAGSLWKALCPFHNERTPSFTVNPQRGMFKCFGCGAGGGPIRFVMQYENLSFVEAARKLAERAGIRLDHELMSTHDEAQHTRRRRLLALHADAAEFFHLQLMKKPDAQPARDYLKSRGITSETARSWKIGYAPDAWRTFVQHAQAQGFHREELLESGLAKLRDEAQPGGDFYDRFRHRVMFPICNDSGEVIAFSGRILEPDSKAPKYVNSPETPLFTKGAVLFGLHKSKRALIDAAVAIVCEGQLDLITAFEAGIQNVVAPQGTAFTERQAKILRRYSEKVILCFDSDAAGEKAAERSLEALLGASLEIRVATMPAGEDPDSMIRRHGADAFRQRIADAQDYFDFRLAREALQAGYATPKGKLDSARRLAENVGLIADPVLRSGLVNKIAMRLEIAPQDFARMLRSPRRRRPTDDGPGTPATTPCVLDPTVRLLCVVALQDDAARSWLLEEHWPEMLEIEPGTELLQKILAADLEIDNPASIQGFLTRLDASEEAAVAGLIEEKPHPNALSIAHDCWRELDRRRIQRRIDACQARLRQPDMPDTEVAKLQKEVLDLKSHLANLSRLFPPPL